MKIINRFSLKKLIAVFTLIFTLVPSLIINFFMYYEIVKTVRGEYMENYVSSIFYGIEENLGNVFEGITTTALNTIGYVPLYQNLVNDFSAEEDKREAVVGELRNILENDSLVDAADIILNDGTVYRYSKKSVQNLAACDSSFLAGIKQSIIELSPSVVYDSGGESYCAVAIKYNNYMNINDLGTLVMYVNTDKMQSVYDAVNRNEAEIFVTFDDTIILHEDEKYIGTVMYEKTIEDGLDENHTYRNYVVKLPVFNNKLKINMIAYNNAMYNMENKINIYLVVFVGVTISISIFIAFMIANRLSKKIVVLVNEMKNFSKDRDSFVKIEEENEFMVLEQQFNKMATEIKSLILQNEMENEQKRIAELNALQSQINPHFLYNVLDSIKWMAKLHKPYENIEEITYALSNFFRISLHNGEEYIKVSEEIEHVNCYLTVENIRHKGLFESEIEIDETILDRRILKIILQPLVENAIKHGFKNITYKGKIKITGKRSENGTVFCVTDNGLGFDVSKLSLRKNSGSGGYGLKNVYERIKLAYNKESDLKIESEPGKGTTVTITLVGKPANLNSGDERKDSDA